VNSLPKTVTRIIDKCEIGLPYLRTVVHGGGYTQRGVAKGLKVPCLFMITEVSIRCQKNSDVGIRGIPAYTPPPNTPLPAEVPRCTFPDSATRSFTQTDAYARKSAVVSVSCRGADG